MLLRGINLGPTRRVPMAELRTLFSGAGYGDVQSYLQSGNLALDSERDPAELERHGAELISERFGFAVPVIVRAAEELAGVLARDPLGAVATDPKRYQVSFLSAPLAAGVAEQLQGFLTDEEALVIDGRECYAWHPAGVARSKLWTKLARTGLGVTATTRNWTTVRALAEMTGG